MKFKDERNSYYRYSGFVATHGKWNSKPVEIETTAISHKKAVSNIKYRIAKMCGVSVSAITIEDAKVTMLF